MSTYLHYYEEEDRGYDQSKQEEKELIPWSDEECERTIPRKKEMRHFAKPQDVSKEWAKLFLEQWNQAVRLWDGGGLFTREYLWQPYKIRQLEQQKEYSAIVCSWLIPHGFVEPHCAAEGK